MSKKKPHGKTATQARQDYVSANFRRPADSVRTLSISEEYGYQSVSRNNHRPSLDDYEGSRSQEDRD